MSPSAEARAAYLDRIAARRAIETNMSAAILRGTGAVVEVTCGRPGFFIISGSPDAELASRVVLSMAGLTLVSSEFDDELGEQFATWTS